MESKQPTSTLAPLSPCIEHPSCKLKHYCADCGNFACSKCLKKHIGHMILYWDVLVEFAATNASTESAKIFSKLKNVTTAIQGSVNNILKNANEQITKKMEEIETENKQLIDTIKGKNFTDEKLMMLKMVATSEVEYDHGEALMQWVENQVNSIKKDIVKEINRLDLSELMEGALIKKEAIIHLFKDNSKDLFLYNPLKKVCKKYILNIPPNIPELANSIQIGKMLYLMGGKRGGAYISSMYEFSIDAPSENWGEKAPLVKAKYAVSPCSLGTTTMYVVGGYNGNYLVDVEKYYISSNTWSKLPPLSCSRSSVSTGIMNRKYLYALGGENGITSCERMDIEKETGFERITIINEVNVNFGDMSCVEYPNGELFLFGLYGCYKLKSTKDNEHTLTRGSALIKNEYFWPYSAAMSDKQNIYGVDRYQNIHVYIKDESKWELVPNSIWK